MANTTTKIKWNSIAYDEILHAPALIFLELDEAERLIGIARGLAASFAKTGRYMNSIHAVRRDRNDRVAYDVVAEVPYALKIEKIHGVLSRALDISGI